MTRQVRVGDVLRLERTRISPDPAATYRQIGIYSWGKGIIENDAISGADLSKVTYYRFPTGALMLSNIQAWEAAIAVSEERHADFIASQRFLPYVPIAQSEVDVRYLLHFFLSEYGIALIRKASPGTVTRNRTLGMKAFEDLVIPLPPVNEQQIIAARLDHFDELSRLQERQRAVIAALPQAARNEVFSKLV
jgi:type I restriction enzyme, S subunit